MRSQNSITAYRIRALIIFTLIIYLQKYAQLENIVVDILKESHKELVALLPDSERIAWMCCIITAFIIPEVLGIFSAIKACLFKRIKRDKLPSITNFLFSIFIEILHSVGMALLFLVCLPDLNVLQAASIMSCVCFIPSLLGNYYK